LNTQAFKFCGYVRNPLILLAFLSLTSDHYLSNSLTRSLTCHPDAPVPFPPQVEVAVRALSAEAWRLRYVLSGDIAALRVPAPSPSGWAEALWRHTCGEVFLGDAQGHYLEGNFSPSGAWAVYRFSGYRAGMTRLPEVSPSVAVSRHNDRELALELILPLTPLWRWLDGSPWRLGLSVVAEDTAGRLYYWALHPPENRPDFHHPDAFVLGLKDQEIP
jgi:hypothetical protein